MNQQKKAEAITSRANRSAKRLLLDKRFQLKYTAMIVSVAAVLSLSLGGFLLSKVRENSRILDLESLGDSGFSAQLNAADNELVWIIAMSLVCFMVVITLLSILITHRMAGPIYVMTRHLTTLARGKLPEVRALRKGDEFIECHDALVNVVSGLEKRTMTEVELLLRTIEGLSSEDMAHKAQLKAELQTLLEQKRAILGSD